MLALDLKTGADIWERKVGASPSEPLAYADRIYLASDAKQLFCLDASSGASVWTWAIGTRLVGPAAGDDARVYFVGMDNLLRAVSRASGNQQWKYGLTYRPTSGPVVLGDQVAVPGITGEIVGLAASTGKVTGKLTLAEKLAIGPAFVPPAQGDGTPIVVSVTGGLGLKWTLSAAKPAPDPPATTPVK